MNRIAGGLAFSMLVLCAAASFGAPPGAAGGGNAGNGGGNGGGGGGGGSASTRPEVYTVAGSLPNVSMPLSRVRFNDGTTVNATNFVYVSSVAQFVFNNPAVGRLRVLNSSAANSNPAYGAANRFIEAEDGDATSISTPMQLGPNSDVTRFCDRMKIALANPNLNNRVAIESGPPSTSIEVVVTLATRVWDSHFILDNRPELFIFEEQGNSVLTIQALEEFEGPLGPVLQPVGVAFEFHPNQIASARPNRIYVGRFNTDGSPAQGNANYECQVGFIDLNQLGVPHVKHLRIRSQLTTGPGGGNASADFKILAVDTSPAQAAQTLSFD